MKWSLLAGSVAVVRGDLGGAAYSSMSQDEKKQWNNSQMELCKDFFPANQNQLKELSVNEDLQYLCRVEKDTNTPTYLTAYSLKNRMPMVSFYSMSEAHVTATHKGRDDEFVYDENIDEFYQTDPHDKCFGDAWNRGHLVPSARIDWSVDANATTFNISNVAIQSGKFNQQNWMWLETQTGDWLYDNKSADMNKNYFVVTGTLLDSEDKQRFCINGQEDHQLSSNYLVGTSSVTEEKGAWMVEKDGRDTKVSAVPAKYYKVMCDTKAGKSIGYWGLNSADNPVVTSVSVKEIETAIGTDLFDADICKTSVADEEHFFKIQKMEYHHQVMRLVASKFSAFGAFLQSSLSCTAKSPVSSPEGTDANNAQKNPISDNSGSDSDVAEVGVAAKKTIAEEVEDDVKQGVKVAEKDDKILAKDVEVVAKDVEVVAKDADEVAKKVEGVAENVEVVAESVEKVAKKDAVGIAAEEVDVVAKDADVAAKDADVAAKDVEVVAEDAEKDAAIAEKVAEKSEPEAGMMPGFMRKALFGNSDEKSKDTGSAGQTDSGLKKNPATGKAKRAESSALRG